MQRLDLTLVVQVARGEFVEHIEKCAGGLKLSAQRVTLKDEYRCLGLDPAKSESEHAAPS
jgi:hypothetical protein